MRSWPDRHLPSLGSLGTTPSVRPRRVQRVHPCSSCRLCAPLPNRELVCASGMGTARCLPLPLPSISLRWEMPIRPGQRRLRLAKRPARGWGGCVSERDCNEDQGPHTSGRRSLSKFLSALAECSSWAESIGTPQDTCSTGHHLGARGGCSLLRFGACSARHAVRVVRSINAQCKSLSRGCHSCSHQYHNL